MTIWASIKESLRSLFAHKMRSLLTMLGIFIGIGSVVAMTSVGLGVRNAMTAEFRELGADKLSIQPGNYRHEIRNPKPITESDMTKLAELSFIANMTGLLNTPDTHTITRNDVNASTRVTGIDANFFAVQGLTIGKGRAFLDSELTNGNDVAIIGSELNDRFFPESENAIGQLVRIDNRPYTVVGVLEKKTGNFTASVNQALFVPLRTVEMRLSPGLQGTRSEVTIKVDIIKTPIADAEKLLIAELRKAHELPGSAPDDFMVQNMGSMIDSMNAVFNVFVIFLAAVAGISLVVGGIGIMNIMLVSVAERTKEIGLRKALGAKNRDILSQFLIESSVLSLFGGILGILFGIGLAMLIGMIATNMGYPIEPEIQIPFVLGTALFSMAIGLFFGVYPARRAAALQPVIALRTE